MVPRAGAAPLGSVMICLAFAASGIATVASVSVAGGSVNKASVTGADASKTPAGATLMRRESLAVASSGTVDIDSDVAVPKSQATGSGAPVPLSLADGGKAGRGEEVDGSSRADEESPEGGDLDEEDDEDKEFALRHGLHVPVRPSSLIVIDGHQDDARPIERVVAAAALAETESVSCGGARRAQHCGACLTSRETGLSASTGCRGDCYLTYGGEEDQQCAPLTASIVGSLKGGGDDPSRTAALVALSPEGDLEKAESELAKQNNSNNNKSNNNNNDKNKNNNFANFSRTDDGGCDSVCPEEEDKEEEEEAPLMSSVTLKPVPVIPPPAGHSSRRRCNPCEKKTTIAPSQLLEEQEQEQE